MTRWLPCLLSFVVCGLSTGALHASLGVPMWQCMLAAALGAAISTGAMVGNEGSSIDDQ